MSGLTGLSRWSTLWTSTPTLTPTGLSYPTLGSLPSSTQALMPSLGRCESCPLGQGKGEGKQHVLMSSSLPAV